MDFQVSFNVNSKLFVKDPDNTDIGRQIVKNAIDLIYSLGFEQFTFKKLAVEIQTTEATIYRYFENKHKLLLYILNWYWSYMEFLVMFKLQNLDNPETKLNAIIDLLTSDLPDTSGKLDYNKKFLNQIVISESSKAYLVKDISEINKDEVFKPYKDLCSKIAALIEEYNPNYEFPKSLTTTLIESSHQQQFFSENLPKLTDVNEDNHQEFVKAFLKALLFKSILVK
jgi:AcrR family transcriptional regulator